MYFVCRNNIDLKYTSSSVIHQVEIYLKYIRSIYTWSVLELYLNYASSILEVYIIHTLQVYSQYTWSILKAYFTLVRESLKVVSATFLLVYFLSLNKSTCHLSN